MLPYPCGTEQGYAVYQNMLQFSSEHASFLLMNICSFPNKI